MIEIRSFVGRGMRIICIYTEMTSLSPSNFLGVSTEGHLYKFYFVCSVALLRTFFFLR